MPVSVLCLHFLQLSFEDTKGFIQVNTELFLVFLSKHLFKIRTASFEVGYTAPPALPPPTPALTGWKILTNLSCCMFLSYKHGLRTLTGLTEIMSLLLLTNHAVSCLHSSMRDFPGSPVIKTLLPLSWRGFHHWSRNWDPTCHMARPQTKTNKQMRLARPLSKQCFETKSGLQPIMGPEISFLDWDE